MHLVDKLTKLSDDEKLKAIQAYKRELYRDSLALTARDLLHYREVNAHTHKGLIKTLESDSKRSVIVMPRGTFKSSLCSVAYPIWRLNNNPNLRILLDSELYTNSKNLLREIRLHLESSALTELYGTYKSSQWNEGELTVLQRTKVLKEASITASGLGAEKTGQHYDLIVMDDMNSPNNSGTPEGCEKVIQHFRYAQSILEPGGTIVIVGTRYSELDLIGFVLDNLVNPPEDSEYGSTVGGLF